MKINSLKAGVVVGAFTAGVHAAWAAMVWLGWAQIVADFIFWIHFIRPPYTILPFDLGRAGMLILFTGLSGFLVGWILALVWNSIRPATPPRSESGL